MSMIKVWQQMDYGLLYCLFFKSLKINEKGAGVRPFLHKNGLNLIKNG